MTKQQSSLSLSLHATPFRARLFHTRRHELARHGNSEIYTGRPNYNAASAVRTNYRETPSPSSHAGCDRKHRRQCPPGPRAGGRRLAYRQRVSLPSRLVPSSRDTHVPRQHSQHRRRLRRPPCLRAETELTTPEIFILYTNRQLSSAHRRPSSLQHGHLYHPATQSIRISPQY